MMAKRSVFLLFTFVMALAFSMGTAATVFAEASPQVPLPGSAIPQFVDPLPSLHTIVDGGTQIVLNMEEFQTDILPTGFVPPGIIAPALFTGTWVWGYRVPSQATTPSYIGPVIVANRGAPTRIKFVNTLPTDAFSTNVLAWRYSTDQTMHWADPLNTETNDCSMQVALGTFSNPESVLYPASSDICAKNYGELEDGPVPAVVHLHGGEVPPELDGGPDAWFTSDGLLQGHGYHTLSGGGALGNEAIYRYPNTQEAANIWFHDHVLGITRLNVYAGMAGAYILRDPAGGNVNNPAPANLPAGRAGEPLIPLVIQDRMFDTNGQLFFPADSAGNVLWTTNPEHPYWVPEFVGDTIVVNGKTWPTVGGDPALGGTPLDAKRYRFLFLNGSNARTYELFLVDAVTGLNGPPMWVIGTDGGYLDTPQKIDINLGQKLVIMPGERYDVIIDFADFPNTSLIMRNTGRTPFPKGAPPTGATIGRIVKFFIGAAPVGGDTSYNPATAALNSLRVGHLIERLPGTPGGPPLPVTPGPTATVQKIRQLTLNEVMGLPVTATDPVTGTALTAYPGGPLEVVLNNTKWSGERLVTALGSGLPGVPGAGGSITLEPIPDSTANPGVGLTGNIYYTELPKEGETEVWEIINITADAHPIHLHLVQFQIIDRQNFNVGNYMKAYAGAFPGGVLAEAFGPPYNYSNSNNPDFCTTLNCDGTGTNPDKPTTVGGNPNIRKLANNGRPVYMQGVANPPLAHEAGWKDTVVSYPGQVLRISVRWAPTDATATGKNYFPFSPDGHGYVWHCHIIDHEDNEMMRPTQVQPNLPAGGARTLSKGIDY